MNQLSLWDDCTEQATHTIPFRWADGGTSEADVRRMVSLVTAQTRTLVGWEFVNGHLVSYYAHVLSTWIDAGIVWGRCIITPSGSYANEVHAGNEASAEEDEE